MLMKVSKRFGNTSFAVYWIDDSSRQHFIVLLFTYALMNHGSILALLDAPDLSDDLIVLIQCRDFLALIDAAIETGGMNRRA